METAAIICLCISALFTFAALAHNGKGPEAAIQGIILLGLGFVSFLLATAFGLICFGQFLER